MAWLCLGTIPFMLADSTLIRVRAIWQRWLARLVPTAALLAAMLLAPEKLGLMFTVIPVLVLFYLIYGMMGRWVALRAGPMSAGLGLGIILAWSIAATTPLFAGSGQ